MTGDAYVGGTLVSGVGGWVFAGTSFTRQWESCNAERRQLRDDLGRQERDLRRQGRRQGPAPARPHQRRLQRPEQQARREGAVHAAERRDHRSAPAAGRPDAGPDPDPDPDSDPNPQPSPQPTPQPTPQPDTVAPVIQSLKAVSAKLKPGAQLKLSVGVTEGGTLSVEIQRAKAGRKSGKTCKAGAKKGKKCTVISKVASYKLGVGGSGTVAIPKKKLAAGDYRAVVTPFDAAGNKGAAKTISFKVLKK